MKKLLLVLIVALIPSMIFATTTTATIGGTLKVYETLSLTGVTDMVWPAQYAGALGSAIYTNTGQPAASGITGTGTIGQAGKVEVYGTGGSQFTPSLSAFSFTAGPGTYTAINTATSLSLCSNDPPVNATSCTVVSGLQSLPNPGAGTQHLSFFIQGKINSGVTVLSGNYTGTTSFTATYN